jgi:response regulator RpfG family c-di-GMP phosphodiesterase
MSLTEGTGANSSPGSTALGELLTFFGNVADFAAGASPEEGKRVASLAACMARQAGLPQDACDALYFAARLRNAGALGNPAFAKGEPLPERAQMMSRWDVPAEGARICERIAALPPATADIVRWQSEAWDGTGFPDRLRWSGIPRTAQLLHISKTYVSMDDPDEALSVITAQSGRAYAPEQVRTFTMWFHTHGGEIEELPVPHAALAADKTTAEVLLALLSERIDAHNGTPGRAQRIAARVHDVARASGLPEHEARLASHAALLFAAGELRSEDLEASQFDPLSRLGLEPRAKSAMTAASLIAPCTFLNELAPVIRSRAEWYDGTGSPDGLRRDAIPKAARILAAAIAYDTLDETYHNRITEDRVAPMIRMETAAGTQFDPETIRALAEVARARA